MKQYKRIIFLLGIMFFAPLTARKYMQKPIAPSKPWFKIMPLKEILKKNLNIQYKKVFDEVNFEFEPFSLCFLIPHKGYFKECFILEIPDGRVQDKEGFILIDNMFPQERVWAEGYDHLRYILKIKDENVTKISGRVAVISQEGHFNYCHFMNEVLARLGMLEMHGVEYDWLYVTCESQFVKDGLKLWGVDESKIISPTSKSFCIQADTVMLPSIVLNTNNGFKHTGVNAHPYTLRYVREKLLNKIEGKVDISQFSKRIFISRKDAASRRILNEDEIFELFKEKGFERYELGKMSVLEQIALFSQAQIVVGEHGAGLTNILFCKEGTKVIELFQALVDTSFWFPSQIFNLNYIPVNTLGLNVDYFSNWKQINPNIYYQAQNSKINIPLDQIKNIIEAL